jgi:hypothetical protein
MNWRLLPNLLLLASLSLAPRFASGQAVVVGQDFEGSEFPPQGWLTIDNDNDGNCWQTRAGTNGVNQYNSASTQLAISFTRDPATYSALSAQDNWLVTPAFEVKNVQYVLQFVYAAQDLNCTEPISLLVSNGGSTTADFTQIWSTTVDNGYEDDIQWGSYKKSLSDYEGKTIRLAVRHNASSTYGLSIDNFYVLDQNGPLQPTGFSAKASTDNAGSVTLSWTNPARTALGDNLTDLAIVVYRDGERIAELTGRTAGGADSYVDTPTDGTHKYTIAAKNAAGEGMKLTARSVYVGEDIPKAVGSPIAMALANGTVSLSWTAPTKGVNSGTFHADNVRYLIRRNGTEIIHDLATTSYLDASPVEGVNAYDIVAYNSAGEASVDDHTSAYVCASSLIDAQIAQTAERDNALKRIPINIYTNYSVSQSIYYPSDFKSLTGEIQKIVYKGYRGTSSALNVKTRIYIAATELDALTDWAAPTDADKVFEGTVTLSQGINDIDIALDTPYNYTGGNIIVTVIKDERGYGSYSDRFYSMESDHKGRTFTTDTSETVDIASLPHGTSDASLDEVPSTRFIMTPKGVASLRGKVTNADFGTPVEGAKVSVDGYDGINAITDSKGSYTIAYIPVAATTITVSKVGYVDNSVKLTLTDGATSTVNVELMRNANFILSGKVTCGDTGLNAEGAVVELSGYESLSTTVGDDGKWSISGVYVGKDYTITVNYPLYAPYVGEFNYIDEGNKSYADIPLERALIAPWNVDATVSDDGARAVVTWSDPTQRDVAAGTKSIGDVSKQKYTGGDYYSDVFNVAHAFSLEEIAKQKMEGLVVASERVYLAASEGTFTAKVWRGTRDSHVEVASQLIPASAISADGGWVTVDFELPAEIKAGAPYLVGVEVANLSSGGSSCIGTSNSSTVYGGNNIKWGDSAYSGNGYSPWCIEAVCKVPGTDNEIVDNPDAPKCGYNVYRGVVASNGTTTWTLLNSTPVSECTLTDDSWSVQVADTYVYGVTAVYNKAGESVKAYSDKISRAVDTDVAVTKFVSPVKSIDIQTAGEVIVTVTNFGELPVTEVPVELTHNGTKVATATLNATLNKGESANLSLGNVEFVRGMNTFTATTQFSGDKVSANNTATFEMPNFENVNLTGYRWDAYGSAGFMQFGTNNPEGAQYKVEVTPNDALIIAGEAVNGTFYGFTATWWGESREFVEINPTTWLVTRTVENTNDYVLDMAYNYPADTMYCLTTDYDNAYLGTVDLTTGVVTRIGDTGHIMRTLACDLKGTLYAIDSYGMLYTLDATTGSATYVGNTAVGTAAYLQSMAFDHSTGRLFWAHTNSAVNGVIYELDAATASATRMGTVMYNGVDASEIVGMYAPYTYTGSGIATVGDDAAKGAARYYTLQGIEVAQPERGTVYVVRYADGTSAKLIYK